MGIGGYGQFITLLCCSFLLMPFLCSSVGSLPQDTVLHELLQHQSLPQGAVPARKPAPAWAPFHGPKFPSGHTHLLWHGVLHGLQVDICSTVDLHGLQRHNLCYRCLLYGLQGNLCSCVWSTSSSSSSFSDLGVCRVVSHIFSLISPSCCCAAFLTSS